MRLPKLDERLSLAARMMPACAYGADIGADHGRLSCYLLAQGICKRMCVADISEASLAKARRLLTMHGLADRADFCLGDGLSVLPRPAGALAILGMGGYTVAHILQEGEKKLAGATLILSAHTDLPYLRETIMDLSYTIEEEHVLSCGGRFYVVMKALPGMEALNEKQLFLGPRLMEQAADDVYRAYLEKRLSAALCRQDAEAEVLIRCLKEEYRRVSHGSND